MDIIETITTISDMDEDTAEIYVKLATAEILMYTKRTVMLDVFNKTLIDLVLAMYQRSGLQGVVSHSEGGISTTWGSSGYEDILKNLNSWRLAKAGGSYHEVVKEDDDDA